MLYAITTCLKQLISLKPPEFNDMKFGKFKIKYNNIKLKLGPGHLDYAFSGLISNETHIFPQYLPVLGEQYLAGNWDWLCLLHQFLISRGRHESSLDWSLRLRDQVLN